MTFRWSHSLSVEGLLSTKNWCNRVLWRASFLPVEIALPVHRYSENMTLQYLTLIGPEIQAGGFKVLCFTVDATFAYEMKPAYNTKSWIVNHGQLGLFVGWYVQSGLASWVSWVPQHASPHRGKSAAVFSKTMRFLENSKITPSEEFWLELLEVQ